MARAASSTTRKVVKKTATKKSSSKSTKAKSTKKPVAKKTPDAKKSRTRAVVNKAKVKTTTSKKKTISDEQRNEMVEKAAYYLAESRGFDSRYDQLNWIEAEQKIAKLLAK